MTRINTNTSSLNAQKTLRRNNEDLQTALTRLSTGLRINSGKDDPAGLIAAEIMQSDIRATQQAITNTERGNQMIATADSALGSIGDLLHDIRALVTEVANTAVMSDEQIEANQLQVDAALEAINRIAQVTSFQGRSLLNGSLDFITNADSIAQIENLKIDKANLGTANEMDVLVEIASAAEQAQITTSSGESQAEAEIRFASRTRLEVTGANTGDVYIQANSLSEEFHNVKVIFNNTYETGSLDNGATASFDTTQKILYVNCENGASNIAFANVEYAIESTELFTVYSENVEAADTVATLEWGGNDNGYMTQDYITVQADARGEDWNDVQVKFAYDESITAGAPTAAYDSESKTITVTMAVGNAGNEVDGWNSLSNIASAINDLDDFSASTTMTTNASNTADNTYVFGSFDLDTKVIADTAATGYLKSSFSDATRAQAVVEFSAGVLKTFTTDSGDTNMYIKAAGLGDRYDQAQVQFVADASAVGQESADLDAGSKTFIVHYFHDATTSSTIDQIATAINASNDWEAVIATPAQGTRKVNSGQTTVVTSTDSIVVEATEAGANFNNMQVVFEAKEGQGPETPKAKYDAGTNTFTFMVDYSSAAPTRLEDLVLAVNEVEGFAGYMNKNANSAVGGMFGGGVDATVVGNTGSSGGNALLDDLVVEISGPDGAEVFTFNAGTTSNQMASAISLVADAIGVEATFNNDLVTIQSLAYGSDSFVSVAVLSEGSKGTLTKSISASRDTGEDVDAKINGVQATSKGNKMWVNTSTLGVTIDVTAGVDNNFRFNISGGGAQFQLGPDVVSNQQVRIGIQSLNTARLGGVNGALYQLNTGGSADLSTDPNMAAKILGDAIGVVTDLRGRLGALQSFTMDTNIRTLEDTMENLTQAESQIRDADFAVETANLTRAQVLVQSGTSVLGIANQNPQNVLGLLQ